MLGLLEGRATVRTTQAKARRLAGWAWDDAYHGTARRQVGEHFESVERRALLPMPAGRFPFFHEARRRVHRDGHVEVAKAYYSVPPELVGRDVWARWDGRVVRILDMRLVQVLPHCTRQPCCGLLVEGEEEGTFVPVGRPTFQLDGRRDASEPVEIHVPRQG